MGNSFKCCLWLLISTVALPAMLAEPAASEQRPRTPANIFDCGNTPTVRNNAEWLDCEMGFIKNDKLTLEKAAQDLKDVMPEQSKSDFQIEEDAWSAYMEKACKYYYNGDWGRVGQFLDGPLCLDAIIVARTKELRERQRDLTH